MGDAALLEMSGRPEWERRRGADQRAGFQSQHAAQRRIGIDDASGQIERHQPRDQRMFHRFAEAQLARQGLLRDLALAQPALQQAQQPDDQEAEQHNGNRKQDQRCFRCAPRVRAGAQGQAAVVRAEFKLVQVGAPLGELAIAR